MPRERVLNLDHVDTVAKGFIVDRITTLSAEKLHSVCRALDVATGADEPPAPPPPRPQKDVSFLAK
jgi:hypothetical protein